VDLAPKSPEFQAFRQKACFQRSVSKGAGLEEFIDVVSFPVVFAAGKLNEILALVDVVELVTGGLKDQVLSLSNLIGQPAVGPFDAGVFFPLLLPEPLQTFSDHIESRRGTDGLEEERPLGIGSTEEKEPIPVPGPLKPVMRSPDEEVGESPF